MAYSGRFKPTNPKKYRGDFNNIIYRSSWECKFMNYLDRAENVVSWSSEEVIIPYLSPIDGKWHRYFVDFYVQYRAADGNLNVKLIEIKPFKQTQPPQKKKRITKQYITEVTTWGINEAKWKAATEYCKDRGWKFQVLTEKELGIA